MIFYVGVIIMNQQSSYVVPTYPQLQQKEIKQEVMMPNKNNLNKSETKHMLFFSNHCPHSVSLLKELQKENKVDDVELICVDNRVVKENIIYVTMPNYQQMPLPPMINSVPTLCILPNYEILTGKQIKHYFMPLVKELSQEKQQLNNEPNAFSLGSETNGSYGVSSDTFSFWDTTHEELSASGNGGMKQTYTYSTLEDTHKTEPIYTPQDDTNEGKQTLTLEQLQQQRQNEL